MVDDTQINRTVSDLATIGEDLEAHASLPEVEDAGAREDIEEAVESVKDAVAKIKMDTE